MPDCAELEVIGGPMDGLGCCLAGPATAGRKVGNPLSLALDDQVSGRHLEFIREGHDWCARDLGSTNGTYLMSQRLTPGRSYPLKNHDLLLLGSTVLLFSQAAGEPGTARQGLNFDDPARRFAMTPELARVWQGLMDGLADNATPNRFYCDVDRFLLATMAHIRGHDSTPFDCEQRTAAPSRYQVLARWLHDLPVERNFHGNPQALTVAPRLWRVFELAAGEGQETVGIDRMLAALIREGRSLAARHMALDARFLAAYRPAAQTGGDEATLIAALRAAAQRCCRHTAASSGGAQPAAAHPAKSCRGGRAGRGLRGGVARVWPAAGGAGHRFSRRCPQSGDRPPGGPPARARTRAA